MPLGFYNWHSIGPLYLLEIIGHWRVHEIIDNGSWNLYKIYNYVSN